MSGINVKFGATDAGFTSTVSKVKSSVNSLETNVKQASGSINASFASMAKAGAAVAVGFGAIKMAAGVVTGAVSNFKEALDMGGTLNDMSAQTGIAIDQLLILRRTFENAGLSADGVKTSVNKMQKAIYEAATTGGSAAEPFAKLKINLEQLSKQTPSEQLQTLGKAINELPSPAERAAVAMQIFGKSGATMLALFKDGKDGIEEAKNQLGSMPGIMLRSAAVFDKIGDNFAAIKEKAVEFAVGLLEKLAPALDLVSTLMSRFDAAAAGAKLGEILTGNSKAMDGFTKSLAAFTAGDFQLAMTTLWTSIKLQAADSINSIYANLKAATAAALEFLSQSFGPGSGIWTMLEAGFDIIGAKISIAIGKGLSGMLSELPMIGDQIKESLASSIALLEKEVSNSSNVMSNAMEQIPGDFNRALDQSSKKFDEVFKSSGQLLNTTQLEIDLQKSKIEILQKQSEEASKQVDQAAILESLTIKAGGARVSYAERIKELESEIATARNVGNDALAEELEATKKYYEELEKALKNGKTEQEAMVIAAQAYANSLDKAGQKQQKITKEIKDQLSLSKELAKKIKEAEAKDKIDPGGRLEKRANEQIAKGNFRSAERSVAKLEQREAEKAIREAFGGEDKFKRSIKDLAKQEGIDTFGKSSKQLREELAEKAKQREKEMPPGKGGQKQDANQPGRKDPKNDLQQLVTDIKSILLKIEPKLPPIALGA